VGERVIVGRVGRAHGVRGDVTLEVRTDVPERRFAVGARLLTDPAGPAVGASLVVAASRWHSGRLLVRFDGVVDRSGAEALRGAVLTIDVDEAGEPGSPGEDAELWWDRDLVGLRARTPGGAEIGTVVDVVHTPAGDLLALGAPDGREHLVPFVREIVPTVEVAAGTVVVDPPPGLLDLGGQRPGAYGDHSGTRRVAKRSDGLRVAASGVSAGSATGFLRDPRSGSRRSAIWEVREARLPGSLGATG
jgi:16S rRNA processing protein RimM